MKLTVSVANKASELEDLTSNLPVRKNYVKTIKEGLEDGVSEKNS